MSKKAAEERRKQGVTAKDAVATVTQQLMLPLIMGIDATRKGLMSFVHQMGLLALGELLEVEAPKGKLNGGRTANHWGRRRRCCRSAANMWSSSVRACDARAAAKWRCPRSKPSAPPIRWRRASWSRSCSASRRAATSAASSPRPRRS
jgi:hypothetical protein